MASVSRCLFCKEEITPVMATRIITRYACPECFSAHALKLEAELEALMEICEEARGVVDAGAFEPGGPVKYPALEAAIRRYDRL